MAPVALNAEGGEKTDFLFDANLSDKFEPIGKVASGGERSRLMLSIQSLVAKKLHLPTLIFDEIDTGISGEAARQVGLIMKSMSSDHQLIVITHQPQIAAKADQHYFVHKQKKGDRIFAAVKVLKLEERVDAIAQMISGAKPSEASLKSASEMMSQSHKN
jgi:DNA repair protein RecN (Recombination protein N)